MPANPSTLIRKITAHPPNPCTPIVSDKPNRIEHGTACQLNVNCYVCAHHQTTAACQRLVGDVGACNRGARLPIYAEGDGRRRSAASTAAAVCSSTTKGSVCCCDQLAFSRDEQRDRFSGSLMPILCSNRDETCDVIL